MARWLPLSSALVSDALAHSSLPPRPEPCTLFLGENHSWRQKKLAVSVAELHANHPVALRLRRHKNQAFFAVDRSNPVELAYSSLLPSDLKK